MGTPEFSVPCFAALCDAGHEIALAVTQPDKPQGRRQTLTPPPVKVFAESRGIPVFQPATLRTDEAVARIAAARPELIIVVAYGKLLPEAVLTLPPYGCINVHASLLPRHRGASPIQAAILCGDTVTGVTTMRMDAGLDTGDILLARETPIDPDETAADLHDRLATLGADLLCETVDRLQRGDLTPTTQDGQRATYCTTLTRESGRLDFSEPAAALYNRVRGLYDWPAAYAFLDGRRLTIRQARPAGGCDREAGETWQQDARWLVACGDGNALELLEVQFEGSRPMPAADALRGHPLPPDARLT